MSEVPNGNEAPPPLYATDPAWSPMLVSRMDALFEDYNEKRLAPENALVQLTPLIEEVEATIRSDQNRPSNRAVYEDSVILQRLLYGYYRLYRALHNQKS